MWQKYNTPALVKKCVWKGGNFKGTNQPAINILVDSTRASGCYTNSTRFQFHYVCLGGAQR